MTFVCTHKNYFINEALVYCKLILWAFGSGELKLLTHHRKKKTAITMLVSSFVFTASKLFLFCTALCVSDQVRNPKTGDLMEWLNINSLLIKLIRRMSISYDGKISNIFIHQENIQYEMVICEKVLPSK